MKRFVLPALALALLAAVAAAASKGTGLLKCADKGTVVELTFANGQKLNVNNKGAKVPEGTYSLSAYALLRQGTDRKVWRIEAVKGKLGDMASITVNKDETQEIDVGAPFTLEPMRYRAEKDKAGNRMIPIGYTLTGKNGESYALEIKMGAQNAKLPYFQITDPNGKVLKEGQFEYG